MTPREKAAAVVIAGMPAGPGFGGVLVRQWNTESPRPRGSLVFADQEGGTVKSFASLAPSAGRLAVPERRRGAAGGTGDGRGAAPRRCPGRRSRRCSTWRTGRSARASSRGPSTASRSRAGLGRARVREALPRPRLDAAVDRRGAGLRRPPQQGPRAVSRRDPGRRPVRDGRPRDLSAVRAAPRFARAGDVSPAARARLPRRRRHRLARRPRQPVRALLGAARAARPGRTWC